MFTNTITTSSSTTALPSFLSNIKLQIGGKRQRHHSESANTPVIKRKRRNSEEGEKVGEIPALVYREIDNYVSKYPRFGTYNHVNKFIIRSVSSDPEEDLRHIFGNLIDKAEKNSGGNISEYNVLIFADGLENPINIPMRPKEQNSPEAIVHQIAKVRDITNANKLAFRLECLQQPSIY
jgi:hypothetical protein